ncbi:cell division protein zipA [Vibrio ishigakensis]|uniref:Cell division protein ZipA n=1 Tax=Vibrio ishigakensis TaxID=1481914 RepID=A0A0B8NT67_9VIBR|nr:cell division protein ZipA [Vibrio ishigakensis]GAM57755.1 cell division protein zipA [Vibrio ishigakensis]
MQELRIVLIVVGVLAIAGLLIHGLWTNRREQSGKFSDKPLGKLETESTDSAPAEETVAKQEIADDDFEVVKKVSKSSKQEPSFGAMDNDYSDPLLDSEPETITDSDQEEPIKPKHMKADDLPTITISSDAYSKHMDDDLPSVSATDDFDIEPEIEVEPEPVVAAAPVEEEPEEEQLEVLVLHVKANHNQQFVGTQLFDSMEQNGLHFGAMSIYHRHADLTGNDKVLFSVANMMKPGSLAHDDPETFITDGISFFMTLPCYGDAEQNFKIMLHTAQMIADDLGGNVLDDKYALMTRDRIDAFKRQVQQFEAKKRAKQASQVL